MDSYAVPMLLAATYVILVVSNFGHTVGGFFSLQQVSDFLHNRALLLAAWIHFGAMDLFVGIGRQKMHRDAASGICCSCRACCSPYFSGLQACCRIFLSAGHAPVKSRQPADDGPREDADASNQI